jgi:hypothetical protein
MTTKQFYLLCLFGITFIAGCFLIIIWRKIKTIHTENKGLLFISLSSFSWALVAAYKFYDPPIPELINAINDRILSAFSNLFLLASLPYFPNLFIKLKQRFSFFRNPEQWVINVFVFFAVVTVLFTVIDRTVQGDIGKKIIIAIDSLISTTTMTLVAYAIYQSITNYWQGKAIRYFVLFFFFMLITTQIILPSIAIFPAIMKPFYYYALLMLLFGLVFFNYVAISYFSMFYIEISEIERIEHQSEEKENYKPTKLQVGYDSLTKSYFIEIEFSQLSTGNTKVERVELQKLLRPFTNWVLFALAKKAKLKLSHPDIPTTKYRMVEIWNKNSQIQLNQSEIFANDSGNFELQIEAKNIQFLGSDLLKNKYMLKETILQYAESIQAQASLSSEHKTDLEDEIIAFFFHHLKDN